MESEISVVQAAPNSPPTRKYVPIYNALTVKKALVRFVLRELHKSDNFSKINKVLVLNEQLEP